MKWADTIRRAATVIAGVDKNAAELAELEKVPKTPVRSQPLTPEQIDGLTAIAEELVRLLPDGFTEKVGENVYRVEKTPDTWSWHGRPRLTTRLEGFSFYDFTSPRYPHLFNSFSEDLPELVSNCIDRWIGDTRNDQVNVALFCLARLNYPAPPLPTPSPNLRRILDTDFENDGSVSFDDLMTVLAEAIDIRNANINLLSTAKDALRDAVAMTYPKRGSAISVNGQTLITVQVDPLYPGGLRVPDSPQDILHDTEGPAFRNFLLNFAVPLVDQMIRTMDVKDLREAHPRIRGVEAVPSLAPRAAEPLAFPPSPEPKSGGPGFGLPGL